MDCSEKNCYCEGMCAANGACIFDHHLFAKNKRHYSNVIKSATKHVREKVIIDALESIKPPKVSGAQIRWWNSRKTRKKPKAAKRAAPMCQPRQYPKHRDDLIKSPAGFNPQTIWKNTIENFEKSVLNSEEESKKYIE